MFSGVAEGRGVSLQAGDLASVTVRGNPAHLRQVLNNLIDNAVKYTSVGGNVIVNLLVHKTDQQAELRVSDTGQGISDEEQRHIFERFYRAEATRSRAGGPKGAGLGLSICQSVVNNHGGSITCTSEANVGTTFTVLLPIEALLRADPHRPLAQRRAERNQTPEDLAS
jgi:signal transduction histidine kinase